MAEPYDWDFDKDGLWFCDCGKGKLKLDLKKALIAIGQTKRIIANEKTNNRG